MFVETVVLIGSGNSEHTSCITDISRDSVDTLYVAKAEKILGIADKIILMNNGKIVKIGKKSEVMSDLDFDNSCPIIGGYRNEWFR